MHEEQSNDGSMSRALLMAAGGVGAALLAQEVIQRRRETDLSGQVALITGSSRGLGWLLAREFVGEGCRLVICARDDGELAQARDVLEGQGAEVLAVRCDVADRDEVARMVEAATRRFGGIDILVNNAGIIEVAPVQNSTLQDYENALGVMFWGVVYPTLAVLPQMLERRAGRIVNITSIGGKVSIPHLLPYSSAKFAAVGFSEGLRAELIGEGIPVVTIVPGLMRTGGHLNARFKGRLQQEYTWFSLGASLPFISMDAERAARQIVRATKRGEAERILSLPAQLLARFHGLFPGLTADMLGLVNRFVLPRPDGDGAGAERGAEIQERLHSRVLDTLTAMGVSAGRRYQHGLAPAEVSGGNGHVQGPGS